MILVSNKFRYLEVSGLPVSISRLPIPLQTLIFAFSKMDLALWTTWGFGASLGVLAIGKCARTRQKMVKIN